MVPSPQEVCDSGLKGLPPDIEFFAPIARLRKLDLPKTNHVKSLLDELHRLAERANQERFHFAVLGQFNRGKSTLLNALLGTAVLPVAVTPLTAISTYIKYGKTYRLQAKLKSGEREDLIAPDAGALQALMGERVTEARNPKNSKGYFGVEIEVPSPFLADGQILVDTPGVGSTFRHNTEIAHQTLPDCDAAILSCRRTLQLPKLKSSISRKLKPTLAASLLC